MRILRIPRCAFHRTLSFFEDWGERPRIRTGIINRDFVHQCAEVLPRIPLHNVELFGVWVTYVLVCHFRAAALLHAGAAGAYSPISFVIRGAFYDALLCEAGVCCAEATTTAPINNAAPRNDSLKVCHANSPLRGTHFVCAVRICAQSFSFSGYISKISPSDSNVWDTRIVKGRVYIFGSSNVMSTSR